MSNNGINDVPDLKIYGAQPFGGSAVATALTNVTVTGALQDRPAAARSQPQLFKCLVTAAAAVVLTCGPGTTRLWKAGDQIRFYSTATLANIFTANNAAAASIGRISTVPTHGSLTIEFDGTNWIYAEGGY